MVNANYSDINLYAQLPIVAELRPKQCRLRLSADAVSDTTGTIVTKLIICAGTIPAIVTLSLKKEYSEQPYGGFFLKKKT